jgi:predicted transglutaminase-like cysteine proteinase
MTSLPAKIDRRVSRPFFKPTDEPAVPIILGRAAIALGMPSLAPMAYTRFCLRHSEDCERQGLEFRHRIVAPTAERWFELATVNRQVNRDIVPKSEQGGLSAEEWRLHPKAGNCKDYAVTKRHELLAQGWPSSALLLSEVVMRTGEHHMVLVVRTDEDDLVLDNLDADIRPVESTPYQWIRIQSTSNPKFWLRVGSENVI